MSEISAVINRAVESGREVLNEAESKKILALAGIPVTKLELAKTAEEAERLAEAIGFPVVMKIQSPDIIHKSDAGGVKLNLRDSKDVRNAFSEITANALKYKSNARIDGVVVQEMAPEGIAEVIIGMTTDEQFGPALMFGIGGILVELMKDVSFRIAPLTRFDAEEMIREIKGFPLLDGFRGKKKADIQKLVDAIMAVSKFVLDYPEVQEMDLNPVFAYENAILAVDARIVLKTHA
ncbi:MAG: acetate--CoA ligase family protein [Candidatus Sigynarchaeota archaeon]